MRDEYQYAIAEYLPVGDPNFEKNKAQKLPFIDKGDKLGLHQ